MGFAGEDGGSTGPGGAMGMGGRAGEAPAPAPVWACVSGSELAWVSVGARRARCYLQRTGAFPDRLASSARPSALTADVAT